MKKVHSSRMWFVVVCVECLYPQRIYAVFAGGYDCDYAGNHNSLKIIEHSTLPLGNHGNHTDAMGEEVDDDAHIVDENNRCMLCWLQTPDLLLHCLFLSVLIWWTTLYCLTGWRMHFPNMRIYYFIGNGSFTMHDIKNKRLPFYECVCPHVPPWIERLCIFNIWYCCGP
jgi:hypothetical protein